MRIGILPLGRPTFDVPFAEEKLIAMLNALDSSQHEIVGPRSLLFDGDAATVAMDELQGLAIDRLLILQVTFTDASVAVEAGVAFDIPLSIWAVPEPRLGARLRLNAFCGLNLASHALGLNHRKFSWAYRDAEHMSGTDITRLLDGNHEFTKIEARPSAPYATSDGLEIANAIKGKRIGCIGKHPDGFHTCAYCPRKLEELSGVKVDELELDHLFDCAAAISADETKSVLEIARAAVGGLEDVNQDELEKSLRLKAALDQFRAKGSYDAFAIRCWPETFTEYGGAVCGPVSMLGEEKVPCACEADVYGALTQLILQETSGEAVFLTDLVDIDIDDNTGVVWHCGQAPISMQNGKKKANATIHTNRRMPLLYEFALKPGGVTLMRISQAFGNTVMMLAGANMLERPMAYTGTSGVLRFERNAKAVLDDLIACGAEHHLALTYGEHRPLLRSVAAAMNIDVLEL